MVSKLDYFTVADFLRSMVKWGYIPQCHIKEALKLAEVFDPTKEIQL